MANAKKYVYDAQGKGACCTSIAVELQGDVISGVEFTNGCHGNHQGIQRLVQGRSADEVVTMLEGIPCQNGTSCPDQLAKALREARQ
jgi:uncharacterized protein (TIGR03905 family)